MYIDYIAQLQQQRSNNPLFLKLFNLLPLTQEVPKLDITYVIDKVIKENYEYTGNIKSKETLYKGYTSNYYEFVLIKPRTTIERWKYLYVPITDEFTSLIKPKLPNINYWEVLSIGEKVETIYPNDIYLIEKDLIKLESKLETFKNEYTHKLLPYMIFTGFFSRFTSGEVVYEYKDSKGYYGPLNHLYLSKLKPLELEYPVGSIFDEDIEQLECMQQDIGNYPSYGYYTDNLVVGKFSGFTTTKKYDNKRIYYLYNYDAGSFLSKAKPSQRANAYIESLILNQRNELPFINLEQISTNSQAIEIAQKSQSYQFILE